MVLANTVLGLELCSSYRITQETPHDEILWETVVDRNDIDHHLLQYNRDFFVRHRVITMRTRRYSQRLNIFKSFFS
jgi:hypothetical protein